LGNPTIYGEPGHQGTDLVSLAGVPGNDRGREISSYSVTLGSGIVLLLQANPQRIAAVIQNYDDPAAPGSFVQVYLGGVNTIPITLSPLGTLQIDVNLPWAGEIYVNTTPNSPVVVANEVSIA